MRSSLTAVGGNQVYDLVVDTAMRISTGDLDVAVVCAAESMRTRRADHAHGVTTEYLDERDGAAPDDVLGTEHELTTAVENAVGVHHPVRFYAMAETALRHRLGESVDTHRDRIARLWSRGSEIAATNPHAWLQRAQTAAETATPSEHNRPIAAPYPEVHDLEPERRPGRRRDHVLRRSGRTTRRPARPVGVPVGRVGRRRPPDDDHQVGIRRVARDAAGRPRRPRAGRRRHRRLRTARPLFVLPRRRSGRRELAIDPACDWTITGGLTFAAA
ncbi:MAG: hypothetical protein R2697_11825 [Ilumatobacteraceae bacterium]